MRSQVISYPNQEFYVNEFNLVEDLDFTSWMWRLPWTCYANLSDKSGQTHVEMFEMSNCQFPPFPKNKAHNSCYSRLMTYTSSKEMI